MFPIFEFVIYTYDMQHHKVHNIPVYNYILPQKYIINEKSMNKDKKCHYCWRYLKVYFVTDRFNHCCKTIKIVKAAAKPIR